MRYDDEQDLSSLMSPVGEAPTKSDRNAPEEDADRLASCSHCTHWKDDHDGIMTVPWSGGYMRCANCMFCEAIMLSEDSMLSAM